MSHIKRNVIRAEDSASIDAFGRWRVSNPLTLFDSKQIFDNQPLLWDEAETSGSGTSSAHSADEAATTLSVSATTAGVIARQTFQSFNYQPGKSQLIFMTGVLGSGASGIDRRLGIFNDSNGLFFELAGSTLRVVRRTNVSGTPVDNAVSQASWNVDTMDGSGPSQITIDTSKTQIFFIDFEWLGVGRVRMGFVIDGKYYICHEFLNANSLTDVYMSTPNLPLRYELENDGTGAASDLKCGCSSVISEGGQSFNGVLQYHSTGASWVNANSTSSIYACLGFRLKSAYIGAVIDVVRVTMLGSTVNDNYEWLAYFNPTVFGTFAYSDKTNSAIQTATGSGTATITAGTPFDGGYGAQQSGVEISLVNARRLGAAIDGTVDSLVIAVRPLGSNLDIFTSATWREWS